MNNLDEKNINFFKEYEAYASVEDLEQFKYLYDIWMKLPSKSIYRECIVIFAEKLLSGNKKAVKYAKKIFDKYKKDGGQWSWFFNI